MAAAKSVYALVFGSIAIAIWRAAEATNDPSFWNVMLAVIFVGIAVAASLLGWRAWRNFSVDE